MAVDRSDVNLPFPEAVAPPGKSCGQRSRATEKLIEDRSALARKMDRHDDGGRKIARKILGEKCERLDAPRRRTNGQDATIGHRKSCPYFGVQTARSGAGGCSTS